MSLLDAPWTGRATLVGPGRAGSALARVIEELGWSVGVPLGKGDDLARAANAVELVILATPDSQIAKVAAHIERNPKALVVHLSGALGLDALGEHPRRGSLHPLVSLPNAELGAERLRSGAWFAVCADHQADVEKLGSLVTALVGQWFMVRDEHRALYHAAAVIASNHLVALAGQVARIAHQVDVPHGAFWNLARQSLANIEEVGPRRALTGPVARGDWATVARHRDALDEADRESYLALARLAARLCGSTSALPQWLEGPQEN